MSSAAQLAANIENSKLSTGPRTEAGKAASSLNGITLGLYSRRDFIRPIDEDIYVKLQADLQAELNPAGVLEQNLVDEIRRATWRLRRCGEVEANLLIRLDNAHGCLFDPMETGDEATKIQNSVDRARSQAHRLLHKCTAELKKLQTERKNRVPEPQPEAVTNQTQPQPQQTPRNAQCPCGSGQKHKRCCGRNAPPMLKAA